MASENIQELEANLRKSAALAEAKEKAQAAGQELNEDELDSIAGGLGHEEAPDGHEVGCIIAYHGKGWCADRGYRCTKDYWFSL